MVQALEQLRTQRNSRRDHCCDVHRTTTATNGHPSVRSSVASGSRDEQDELPLSRPANVHRRQDDKDQVAAAVQSADSKHGWQCLALYVSPDLGERIMLSGERSVVEESFPEISSALMDARTNVAWNQVSDWIILNKIPK